MIAVDDSGGDNVWIVRVCTADGDGFALEIDIPVAISGVCAGIDHDGIAMIRIVDCRLDVTEIRWSIIIDVDDLSAGCYGRTHNQNK